MEAKEIADMNVSKREREHLTFFKSERKPGNKGTTRNGQRNGCAVDCVIYGFLMIFV